MELNKVDIKRLRSEVSGEHRDMVHWARANRKGLAEYLTAIAPWGNHFCGNSESFYDYRTNNMICSECSRETYNRGRIVKQY